ncbi:MAG: hypothetical protein WA919_00665 [Coleofasciculaceae cyanobacterium]
MSCLGKTSSVASQHPMFNQSKSQVLLKKLQYLMLYLFLEALNLGEVFLNNAPQKISLPRNQNKREMVMRRLLYEPAGVAKRFRKDSARR